MDSSGEPSELLWSVLCSVPYQIKVSYSVLYQKVFIKKDKQFWAAEVLLQPTTCALCRGRPKLVNWSKVEDTRPSLLYTILSIFKLISVGYFFYLYLFKNFAQSFAWRIFFRIFFPKWMLKCLLTYSGVEKWFYQLTVFSVDTAACTTYSRQTNIIKKFRENLLRLSKSF